MCVWRVELYIHLQGMEIIMCLYACVWRCLKLVIYAAAYGTFMAKKPIGYHICLCSTAIAVSYCSSLPVQLYNRDLGNADINQSPAFTLLSGVEGNYSGETVGSLISFHMRFEWFFWCLNMACLSIFYMIFRGFTCIQLCTMCITYHIQGHS